MSGQLLHQWPVKPIADICEIFSDGNWIESKDQSPSGIRLVQTGNIGEGVFKDRKDKARYISESTFSRLNCTEIFEGDCLISRLPRPVGRACLIPNTGERMITAVDCSILRFKQEMILPQYFVYYSQSAHYNNQIQPLCTGSTRKRISRKNLGKIRISIPPLEVQKRIVSFLDEASNNIAATSMKVEHKLHNAVQIFQSTIDSIIVERGDDWTDVELGQYAEFRNGMNFTKASNGEEIKIVGVGDFQQRFWVPIKLLGCKKINGNLREIDQLVEDDILTVRSNGNRNLIGRCMLVGPISEKISHSGFTIRIRVVSNIIKPRYLCYFMKSSKAKDVLIKGGIGSQISSLNQELLSGIIIPTPPLSIQESIVQRLDDLSAEIVKLEHSIHNKLATLVELKRSILKEAFNGTLRIAEGLADQS